MQQVLILKEKHDTRYYVFDNDETLARIALSILRQRSIDGYWYPNANDVQAKRDSAIEKLQKEHDAKVAEATLKFNAEYLAEYIDTLSVELQESVSIAKRDTHENLMFATRLEKLLELPEDEAIKYFRKGSRWSEAFALLRDRDEYQYEGFEIERTSTP